MSRATVVEVVENGVLEHPASVAWSSLAPECGHVRRISVLKNRGPSRVYRLEGAGPYGMDVVAKRCKPRFAQIEWTIYTEVLPALQVPVLNVLGYLRADGENPGEQPSWLFLEDAGGDDYSYALNEHRALSGQWLGEMHSAAAESDAPAVLPARGPAYYLEILQTVRAAIHRSLANPALNPNDVQVLETILAQYDVLESHWNQIEAFCDRMPQTLIHGDLGVQNARVRFSPDGSSLMILDWERAGWGMPAIDLAQFAAHSLSPDLAVYSSAASSVWGGKMKLEPVAALGNIFRFIVSASWATHNLSTPWVEYPMTKMNFYRAAMAACLRNAGWVN